MNPVCKTLRSFVVVAAGLLIAQMAVALDYAITSISRAGADRTHFWDINNAGLISGYTANSDYSEQTGFVYNSHTGVFTDLTGPAGATLNAATGISDTGVVVGQYTTVSLAFGSFIYEAGAYTDFNVSGALTTLRGISADARFLSGTYNDAASGGFNGFIFDRATSALTDLGPNAIVQGINSHGIVAGSILGSGRRPFLYDIGTGVRTDYTPTTSRYRDVNDGGVIVGFDGAQGIAGLPGSTVELSPPAALSTTAYGIDNAGTVVGFYDTDDFTTKAFIATPVPEPGTWALLLGGLLGLGALRRRITR